MMNFGLLEAEIGPVVWSTPANFNGFRVLASLVQRRCSPEANQTLHDVLPSPRMLHYVYIFRGFCPLTEFCQVQTSLCVQVLGSPTLAALLHGTPAGGVSQTLRRGTRNGITELSQRAPPIFGWAAITLGIGPHSSCYMKTSTSTTTRLEIISGYFRDTEVRRAVWICSCHDHDMVDV